MPAVGVEIGLNGPAVAGALGEDVDSSEAPTDSTRRRAHLEAGDRKNLPAMPGSIVVDVHQGVAVVVAPLSKDIQAVRPPRRHSGSANDAGICSADGCPVMPDSIVVRLEQVAVAGGREDVHPAWSPADC